MTRFFNTDPQVAARLDAVDPLAKMRERFNIPVRSDGSEEIYLCGNSLGLQPKRAALYVEEELEKWRRFGVRGHFEGEHPWMPYHEFLTEPMAAIVGALPEEVVMMNTLTVNLHLMMVSFYRPTAERNAILIEKGAFPSDHYAVVSQIAFHGYDPALSLIEVSAGEDGDFVSTGRIAELLEAEGDRIALVMLPGTQYYSGQQFDIEAITRLAHARGCMVGFDLAHSAGNVPLLLHDWDVDFAVWCSYKYLNSGPGSVAGAFVHQRHARDPRIPRFAGWWGHDKATRFRMGPDFQPIPGAEGWQLSNPPILSLAAVRGSLEEFTNAGGMKPLRTKSVVLTGYLEFLVREELAETVEIVTPSDPAQRGCQLSLRVRSQRGSGRELFDRIEAAGVSCDWREPDVIRVAPVPLYNRFADVRRFVDIMKASLSA